MEDSDVEVEEAGAEVMIEQQDAVEEVPEAVGPSRVTSTKLNGRVA